MRIDRSAQNDENATRLKNAQGFSMAGGKFGREGVGRRALRDLNNIAGGGNAHYPLDIFKKVGAEEEKNVNNFVIRRPITRRFAASLAQNSQNIAQIGSRAQSRGQETVDTIDEGDIESPNDGILSMVDDIEEMIDCEMKEAEMEDIDAKLLEDIDSCDSKNLLAVVKYVNDIYNFYKNTEELSCVPPDYMSAQPDINQKMRAILIDWLIEVHYKFELLEETLFLTVNVIDRFLARHCIPRKKLQLVGVTAMFLACKYEEVMVPVVEDLVVISDRAYTREEVLQMEMLMMNTLQFNMSVPTPYVFMRRFLKAAQYDRKLELLSSYIIELCLVEYEMLRFPPSLLAAAAVYTAQCSLRGFKQWSRTSELCSKYSEAQLLECSRMMVNFHHRSGKGKLIGVHKKYSTFKYECTAKSEPALYLMDMRT